MKKQYKITVFKEVAVIDLKAENVAGAEKEAREMLDKKNNFILKIESKEPKPLLMVIRRLDGKPLPIGMLGK